MAKQKSGLGRGLNALFDSGEVRTPSVPSQVNDKVVPADATDASLEEEKKSSSKAAAKSAHSIKKESAKPSEDSKAKESSKSSKHDILVSEDDAINAVIVEREVPRSSNRPSVSQKQPKTRPAKRALSVEELSTLPQGKRPASSGNQPESVASDAQAGEVKSKRPSRAESAGAGIDSNSAASARTNGQKPVATSSSKEAGRFTIVGEVSELPIDKVKPNPNQPRTSFKREEIEELAQSIKKDGLLQPILVRKTGSTYEIIAGERRYQACCELGKKTIPARLWEADGDKALELALIENIQRSDLNPIEEAYGYKRLMERKGMTQSEIAQTMSKGRSTIANALRLLDLPEEAQQLLFEEKITAGHARAILSIPSAEGRKSLTKKLMDEKLSVREAEAIARLLAGRDAAKESGASKRVPAPASFKKAARGLSRYLGASVRVKTVQGKNKIEIQFQDEDELKRIVAAISHKN